MKYKSMLINKKLLCLIIFFAFFVVLKSPETYSIYKTNLSTTINLTITNESDFTISFDSQGGNSIASKSVTPNQAIGTLQVPVKENNNFLGWYDENGNKVDHNTIATRSMELTAHWQKIVCKKVASASDLHTESCEQTEGNGCLKIGYEEHETITYGNVPTDNSPVAGDAYDCDVDNDGVYNPIDAYGKYTERFYFLRTNTTDDTAVLVYYTSYDEEGRVDSQHRLTPAHGGGSYTYSTALNYLPVNTGSLNDSNNWDNPKLVEFDSTKHNTGRLLKYDDIITICPNLKSTNYHFADCQFLLENSKFQSPDLGRAGIWLEVNSNNEYYRIQSQTLTYEKKTAASENTIRPVIEIPLNTLDGYMDEDEFTISFVVNGGDSLAGVRRYRGQTVGTLPTPHREFYDFLNWYKNPELTILANPNEVVDSNMTVYASWQSLNTATVTYILNGGTGVPSSVTVGIGETINPWQEPTYDGKIFAGWYTDEECTDNLFNENDVVLGNMILYAKWEDIQGVAAINSTGYATLQAAIDACPNTGEKTVIRILNNISLDSKVTVPSTANIEFEIGAYTISSSSGVLIQNEGTIEIKNGSLITSGLNYAYVIDNKSAGVVNITGGTLSSTNSESTNTNVISNVGTINITGGRLNCNAQAAAINNNTGGKLTMSGGEIVSTNELKCQAIYNDGGTSTISNSARLESNSTNRSTVFNNKGTVKIFGGTIVAKNYSAVYNKNGATLIIGNDDGTIDTSSPVMQGITYGLELDSTATATVSDGVFRAKNNNIAINATARTTTPSNTEYITNETDTINEVLYHKAYLRSTLQLTAIVTFDRNDGSGDKTTRELDIGDEVGELTPITRTNYIFTGWYTDPSGGEQITDPTTPINTDVTYYAHWLADITNATISPNPLNVSQEKTKTITVTGPDNLENYIFTSNAPSIATVSNEGVVTGVAVGTTTVTITGTRSLLERTVTVSVSVLTHEVSYATYGGVIVPDSTVEHNQPINPLPTTSQSGKIFMGWFTQESGGTEITDSTPIVSDMTVHAHWLSDITNATISPSSVTVDVGESENITVTGPQDMENYIYTSSAPSIATISNNGEITGVAVGTTTIKITGTRSLLERLITVEVEPPKYHLTLDYNDELSTTVTYDVIQGEEVGELPKATRTDYVFDGWYTSDTGGDPITTSTVPIGNERYYAHWIPGYTITFNSEGGTEVEDMVIVQNEALGDLKPYPTKENRFFGGWFTGTNGSGTRVTSATVPSGNTTYYAYWINGPKAEIDGIFYTTLTNAINDVPTNGIETTIILHANVSGKYTISNGKNVKFNLQNYTISNGGDNVIVNEGKLKIYNGTISCTAGSGAINNNSTGVLEVSGGTIRATGSRQGIYNDGGNLTISGTANISSTTKDRAAVQNRSNGTIKILGGTITSTGKYAIYNEAGTITIGSKDGTHDATTPVIQGKTYGIVAYSSYKFYDGIIKGETAPLGIASGTGNTPGVSTDTNKTKLSDIEDGAVEINGIDGNYKTLYYSIGLSQYYITFNAMGGTSSENNRYVDVGEELGTLPTATKGIYTFDGWFTGEYDGTQITSSTKPSGNFTYYAHWTYVPNLNVVEFDPTNDAMAGYYSNIATWKDDQSTFQDNILENFDDNNCKCAALTDSGNTCTGSGTVSCDKPNGYDTGMNAAVNVYLSDSSKTKGAQVSYTHSNSGVIYNLIPGQIYMWELASDPTVYGYVKSTAERRILETGAMGNVRDLGGLSVDLDNDGIVDGTLKYEKLLRGQKIGTTAANVTELTNLGITEELDLRSSSEASGDTHMSNYKLRDFRHYQNDIEHYPNYYSQDRAIVKEAMQDIVAGENIYFHCRIGADRTGTLAYILEGLLGVVDEDKFQDYELTVFAGQTNRHRFYANDPTSSVSKTEKFRYMYDFMENNQEIYDWYMAAITEDTSLTSEQKAEEIAKEIALIAAFREAMIDKNSTEVSLTPKTNMVYDGTPQAANTATVTPPSGVTFNGTVNYVYSTNNTCTLDLTTTAPTNAGTYYVRAITEPFKTYGWWSSCVEHTIAASE